MPPGHRFPMDKFSRLAAVLEAEGVAGPAGFVLPEPIDLDSLLLVHDEAYVRGVIDLTLPAEVARRVGLPNTESVARRAQAATGGTLAAARLALEHGIACNTAGGSHHAQADTGAGFCVFNDVAVAARRLLAEGKVGQVLVVDLDVHQGDGTARIFAGDPSVFTFSMHAEKNFPARKAVSDLDVDLPDGTGDEAYLEKLGEILPDLLARWRRIWCSSTPGSIRTRTTSWGGLSLSDEGLARREAFVLGSCLERGDPRGGGDRRRIRRRHRSFGASSRPSPPGGPRGSGKA
jgi:acetoin utilization deacetylase AcuC-like enzyme